jgi:hypothetical protein
MKSTSIALAAAVFSTTIITAASHAAVIFDTGTPDGGFFGWIGYDVYVGQSVGVAFAPSQSYTLDSIGVWMMSNDWDNAGRTYTLSLHAGSPTGATLESWNTATAAVGWDPVLDTVNSSLHPTLSAGTTYWIVADSNEPALVDPVWVWGSTWDGVLSGNVNWPNPQWQTGVTYGSAPGVVVTGTLIPAPASGLLALAAMAGFGSRRRS